MEYILTQELHIPDCEVISLNLLLALGRVIAELEFCSRTELGFKILFILLGFSILYARLIMLGFNASLFQTAYFCEFLADLTTG